MKQSLEKQKQLIYQLISSKEYMPMRTKEIAALLQIPRSRRVELQQILDELMNEGKIGFNKKGQYKKKRIRVIPKNAYMTGTYIGHPKGFGFVEVEGEEEDIFIPKEQAGGAMHQDQVQIQIEPKAQGKRREGTVIKILDHGIQEVVGLYERKKKTNYGFVIPDNSKIQQDIFVPFDKGQSVKSGDKVVVTITNYGGKKQNPQGCIKEVLGQVGSPGTDILSIAMDHGLPMEFPARVLKQADRISEQLQPEDYQGRKDLRSMVMVTIDGEDAKDLDDAVSLTYEDGIYHLGVHIADVTNYVQDHSALDREALKRGTSVYLADRVIPMLPKRLSNGICSLNCGEDRLALSCLMDLNEKGQVIGHEMAETVIRVDRRMSYTAVKQILEESDADLMEEYQEFVPMFKDMEKLSKLIRANRKKRGAIDFNFPESKVQLDSKGHPMDIYLYESNVATELIEDFMVTANETVAEAFCKAKVPFLYRTHEHPDPERVEQVLSMVRKSGQDVTKKGQEITPKEVQKALTAMEGTQAEPLLSRLFLRSMKHAQYSTECVGHFGLAAKYYCHFTSPIRRYPDLQIHRIIKDVLRGRMNDGRKVYYEEILDPVALQSSTMERRAEEVERETIKLKKAEYMKDHIGETFDGIISGVTGWGVYVELPNSVEGLVHMTNMTDDYYVFDQENYCVIGERKKQVLRLGDPIKVQVMDASILTRTIDFRMIEGVQENGEG